MPASASVHTSARCPQCAHAMQPLCLEGHYGQTLQTDLCARCDLLWLDELEAVNLSGLGWVKLLRRMQLAQLDASGPMKSKLDCPRCGVALRRVSNLNLMGRFSELECPRCRGGLASFAQLLARRGLVRALTRRDLDVLQAEQREPACLNCGASLDRQLCARGLLDAQALCSYCESPLLVMDMPRFFAALLSRHAEALKPQHLAWACRACGEAVEPTHAATCRACSHAVVVPSMVDLRPVLDAAEPLLRASLPRGAKAHGHKLRAMRGDATQTALYRYWLRFRGWVRDWISL